MKFLPMADLLAAARRGHYAVPSFCVWNMETLLTVLETAEALRSPVMVMTGVPELSLLPPEVFGPMACGVAGRFTVPAALHLDHGDSPELARRAIAAGYSSVMLDFSARSFEENAAALKVVVAAAHPRGVAVEGEIGHVGKADTLSVEGSGDSVLTLPDEAAELERQTGVDALAVSIGNAHGHYSRLPRLDFERLAAIASRVRAPLVLHGGSGTPDADLKRAISLGMAKINVATDLVTAWRESLRQQWADGRNVWAPLALAEAGTATAPVIARWMRLTGAAGRA
ncbi:MAG: class II fructose-bisphosphate aldolase [Lentisphaeria bacterium]